jgi:glucosamine-6-phosphate deaminase
MRLVIEDNSANVGFWVAAYVKKRIIEFHPSKDRPFVLGVASGASTIPVFKALVHFVRAGELSFDNVVTFNIDEYIGLARDDKHSKHSFMWKNFFQHVDIKRENVHMLNGDHLDWADLLKECDNYEEKLAAYGGMELLFMGTGSAGEIGRNDAGCSLSARTRVATLAHTTIIRCAEDFTADKVGEDLVGGVQRSMVPKLSLTMGVGTMKDAREVILIYAGRSKAIALKKSIESNISHMCPASIFQTHARACCVCDREVKSSYALPLSFLTYTYTHCAGHTRAPPIDGQILREPPTHTHTTGP